MLISNTRVLNVPIFSLQTGTAIALTNTAIIDPENLQIVAFFFSLPLVNKSHENILLASSIRDFSKLGIVIDAIDELVAQDDVIKIKKILALNFDLMNLKVVAKNGVKLGKVTGYNLTTSGLFVQQLIVKRPFTKSFLDPELTISREDIIEITDTKIIVKNEHEKKKLLSEQEIKQAFNREKSNQFATIVRDDIEKTTAAE